MELSKAENYDVIVRKVNLFKVILIILSCSSIIAGLITLALVLNGYGSLTHIEITYIINKSLVILLCFLPLPIGSIVFGVIFLAKGYKVKSNIVVGIVFSALLCLYGSIGVLSGQTFDITNSYWASLDSEIEIILPINVSVVTIDYTKGYQKNQEEFTYLFESVARFSEDNSFSSFSSSLSSNWKNDFSVKTVPFEFAQIVHSYDKYLIYNFDDHSFNPEVTETSLIYAAFAINMERMTIVSVKYLAK